eukprot:scaffold325394_cov67-Tisochrysis_lutea.AAC.1
MVSVSRGAHTCESGGDNLSGLNTMLNNMGTCVGSNVQLVDGQCIASGIMGVCTGSDVTHCWMVHVFHLLALTIYIPNVRGVRISGIVDGQRSGEENRPSFGGLQSLQRLQTAGDERNGDCIYTVGAL